MDLDTCRFLLRSASSLSSHAWEHHGRRFCSAPPWSSCWVALVPAKAHSAPALPQGHPGAPRGTQGHPPRGTQGHPGAPRGTPGVARGIGVHQFERTIIPLNWSLTLVNKSPGLSHGWVSSQPEFRVTNQFHLRNSWILQVELTGGDWLVTV